MKRFYTLRCFAALAAVAIGCLTSSCDTLKQGGERVGTIFGGGETIEANARVTAAPDLESKRQARALNAVVLINDRELQTALEGLCIDLGFRPVASKAERKTFEDTKDEWFSDVVQEIRDRKELYSGADIVLAGYVPTYRSERHGEGPKKDTVEVVVKSYNVGTAELWMLTTAQLKGQDGIFAADDPTRLARFEKICGTIKSELDKKSFSGAMITAQASEATAAQTP